METNFFQQVAALKFGGNLQLIITPNNHGQLAVVVQLNAAEGIAAGADIQPVVLKQTPENLDAGFFEAITTPIKVKEQLFVNAAAHQAQLEKAKKQSKPDTKAVKAAGAADDEQEEDNDLFTPQQDDKEAKAAKKRLYDEAMERIKTLVKDMKYTEALAQLPDPEEYSDKVDEINTKRKQLEKQQAIYASLQQED